MTIKNDSGLTTGGRVSDIKDKNLYGIHLHTQVAIERFQINSGMTNNHSVEYQHHYWAVVGRLTVPNQVLDIAIPLVLFNYPQTVSSASVDFELIDVGERSEAVKPLAEAKVQELIDKGILAELQEATGVSDWKLVPMNTVHKHPGRLSSFSGTDYDKQVANPGIVFPLMRGTAQASFSSIICHTQQVAEFVHTEYRQFTGTEKEPGEYRHGKCMSYIRGYKIQPKKVDEQGLISKIFEETPPKPYEAKSYVLKDKVAVAEGKELLEIIRKIWDIADYEPDVSEVKKEYIKEGYSYTQPVWNGIRKTSGVTPYDKRIALIATGDPKVKAIASIWLLSEEELDELYQELIVSKKPKGKAPSPAKRVVHIHDMKRAMINAQGSKHTWATLTKFNLSTIKKMYDNMMDKKDIVEKERGMSSVCMPIIGKTLSEINILGTTFLQMKGALVKAQYFLPEELLGLDFNDILNLYNILKIDVLKAREQDYIVLEDEIKDGANIPFKRVDKEYTFLIQKGYALQKLITMEDEEFQSLLISLKYA